RSAGGRWNSTSWSTGCKLPASPRRVSRSSPTFFSLTETPEDYTIIVDEEGFLELPSSEHLSVADATWLALNVVSGGGSFSSSQPIGVTKIAKSVIAPLADQNISVFMLSTYQTDFILSRGRSSTLCPARATGSVSPAWTLTRCPLLPRSSWTSCSTPL
uniref:Cytosolic arginine sensor for mTORC1 subunit 2 n=1 Tax=Microcebus murinus TaxID=30608 RepID=A0A8C5VQ79_MICMU